MKRQMGQTEHAKRAARAAATLAAGFYHADAAGPEAAYSGMAQARNTEPLACGGARREAPST